MKIRIVFYLFLGLADSLNVDYCKLPCRTNNKTVEHVMCTLKHDCSVGPECKVKTRFDFGEELERFTLDTHNYYRNKVAVGEALGQEKGNLPQAADMLEMVWDEELAHFAQCYANKCILQYDKCRQSSAGENIGQLIFIRVSVDSKSAQEIIAEMLESAFNSSKDMSSEDVGNHKENRYTKQFTQLAWAKTERVGCGITKLLEDLYAFFMVCNYGRAGNVEGEEVYAVGPTCSNCPEGRRCGTKFSGLCAATQDESSSLRGKETLLDLPFSEADNPSETSTSVRVEMPTLEQSYFPHVTTDKGRQMVEDLSKVQKVMFERLVVAKSSTEVPLRKCLVKRRNNWPDLENQQNEGQTERKSFGLSSMYITLILLENVSI